MIHLRKSEQERSLSYEYDTSDEYRHPYSPQGARKVENIRFIFRIEVVNSISGPVSAMYLRMIKRQAVSDAATRPPLHRQSSFTSQTIYVFLSALLVKISLLWTNMANALQDLPTPHGDRIMIS